VRSRLNVEKTIKIVDAGKYGFSLSCSDDDVYDALEDFINENYEVSFSVMHLNPGADFYFDDEISKETLIDILQNFFVHMKSTWKIDWSKTK
jgi:hypothetical protein